MIEVNISFGCSNGDGITGYLVEGGFDHFNSVQCGDVIRRALAEFERENVDCAIHNISLRRVPKKVLRQGV